MPHVDTEHVCARVTFLRRLPEKRRNLLVDIAKCPGATFIRQPKPELVECPRCGYEIEIWTDETKAKCRKCGAYYMKGMSQSCLDWCAAAKECVGDEVYEKYLADRGESSSK